VGPGVRIEAGMSMEVIVTGWRSTTDAWAKAHLVRLSDLPALSPEQADVARKLGLSAEEYARSFYAGELSKPELTGKAEAIGKLIERLAGSQSPGAKIDQVLLETYHGLVRLKGSVGDSEFRMEVEEELVEDLMKGGSGKLLERLERIVKMALPASERRPAAS
jgi:hypothetical protein